MVKKAGRTEDEVIKDFIDTPGGVPASFPVIDDEPEYPDHVLEAMLDEESRKSPATSVAPVAPSGPTLEDLASAPPTMENIMRMMVVALQQVASGQANSQIVAAQALEAASRQTQPDNKQAPGISVFNPQGDLSYPKPRLKCEMFIPWEAEWESLDWEEVELLNLLEDGEYTIKRSDDMKVGVTVKLTKNLDGRPQRLLMNSETQFNDDNHWMMPGLKSILRQVLASRPHTKLAASKVLTMDDRIEMITRGELPVSVGAR